MEKDNLTINTDTQGSEDKSWTKGFYEGYKMGREHATKDILGKLEDSKILISDYIKKLLFFY